MNLQEPNDYLSSPWTVLAYPSSPRGRLHPHLPEFDIRSVCWVVDAPFNGSAVTGDTGLVRKFFRRSGLHDSIF